MTTLNLVAYIRVSTDAQAERGLGLDVQRQTIRRWARTNGHKIVVMEADEGLSGSNGLDARDGLASALRHLRLGAAKGLLVYRLDRLARDLVLQEQLLAEVWRLGCEVFSTSAAETDFLADDPDDPSRRLIRQVLGAVAEYERSLIRLRLAGGRRRKAELGGFAYGAPPFGFRAEGKALVPDPDEQPALQRILDLRKGGASLSQIANTLNVEGLKPKRGGNWHTSSLSRILRRHQSMPTRGAAA